MSEEQPKSSSSRPLSPSSSSLSSMTLSSSSSSSSSSATRIPESSFSVVQQVTTITPLLDEPKEKDEKDEEDKEGLLVTNSSHNNNKKSTNKTHSNRSNNQKNKNITTNGSASASAAVSKEENENEEENEDPHTELVVVDELELNAQEEDDDNDDEEEETDDDDYDNDYDDDTQDKGKNNDKDAPRRRSPYYVSLRVCRTLLLHLFCWILYLLPILLHHHNSSNSNSSKPVLDESPILAQDNRDVNPDINNNNGTIFSQYATIFTNDYWGRPMNSTSSHKSWRPLSVLSFRNVKLGGILFIKDELMGHRFVNVAVHAVLAELVGNLATLLFFFVSHQMENRDGILIRWFTQIIFALHPTHAEVMNAANRPHLLAVLCSLLLCHPNLLFPVFVFVLLCGYLVSETFLFQVVSVCVTLVAISYIRTYHEDHGHFNHQVRKNRLLEQNTSLVRQVWSVLPVVRLSLLMASAVAYYAGRYSMDWLSIPDGMMRLAEHPFHHMEGLERIRNYLYVIAIHVAKAWNVELIGFSHEYGFACIPPIEDWRDRRLCLPAGIAALYIAVLLYLLSKQRRRSESVLSMPLLLFIVHVSWMATLFPITGMIKVGTFIADRIVVPATVSTSMLLGAAATWWTRTTRTTTTTTTTKYPRPTTTQNQKICAATNNNKVGGLQDSTVTSTAITTRHWNYSRLLVLLFVACFMWRRIHVRMTEWMDNKMLLESSLKTCPRFAKGHLDASKIYSDSEHYPNDFNLTKSRWHIQQAQEIDPTFCDVHEQYAHVAVHENDHLEFEDRLTKAMTCPSTITSSLITWKKYWANALNNNNETSNKNTPDDIQAVRAARERYNGYMKVLKRSLESFDEEEKKSGETTSSKSPLVRWKRQ